MATKRTTKKRMTKTAAAKILDGSKPGNKSRAAKVLASGPKKRKSRGSDTFAPPKKKHKYRQGAKTRIKRVKGGKFRSAEKGAWCSICQSYRHKARHGLPSAKKLVAEGKNPRVEKTRLKRRNKGVRRVHR